MKKEGMTIEHDPKDGCVDWADLMALRDVAEDLYPWSSSPVGTMLDDLDVLSGERRGPISDCLCRLAARLRYVDETAYEEGSGDGFDYCEQLNHLGNYAR